MDKRKGIILAVILFLLIGLGTFVFADDPNDPGESREPAEESPDTENDGNGSQEENPDDESEVLDEDSGNGNSDRDELGQSDQEDEETDIIIGDDDSNPSTPGEDTDNETDNSGENPENPTVPGDDEEDDEEVVDTTAPVVTILGNTYQGEGPENSIGYVNTDVVLSLVEEGLTVVIEKDGEALTFEDDMILSSDGDYVLTVTDEAENKTVVEFSIDKSAPVVTGIEDGDITNTIGSITVADDNEVTILLNGNKVALEDIASLAEEGENILIVKDSLDNQTSITFTYDTTPIQAEWLYTLNSTYHNTNLVDKHYQVIGDGQKLYVELVFAEKFESVPTIAVGASEAVNMSCEWTNWETERQYYKCDATITIDGASQSLVNNAELPILINNIVDAAGNKTVLDNDDVTYTTDYGQVKFDGKPPKISALGITGFLDEAEYDPHYVTDGKGIRILTYFSEELGVAPTITINGHKFTAYAGEDTDPETNTYSYHVDIEDVAVLGLDDGVIEFTVSGYKDKFGNEGEVLTQKATTYDSYDQVIYDKSPTTFNFNNGDTFNDFTVKLTEANLQRLEVYSYGTGLTDTYYGDEGLEWTLNTGNCMYKLMAYDLAGNYSEIWIYHDRTAPSVTGTGKVASKDVEFESGKKYQEVHLVVTDNDLKEVKLVNQLTGAEEVICAFNWDNTSDCAVDYDKEGKYNLVVIDRANNRSQYEVIIDTTAPTFDLSQIPTGFEVGVDVYEYPQLGKVTDNMDGTISFSTVHMNWYHMNADSSKGDQTSCFGGDNWNTSLKSCSLGDYIITYEVSDEAGNKGYVKQAITLKDSTNPTINLAGTEGLNHNELRIETGSELTLEDVLATVVDNYDKERTIEPYYADLYPSNGEANDYDYDFKTNGFDTTLTGRYNLYYKTTDASGNPVEAVMLVVINDTTAPSIIGVESNTTYFAGIGNHGHKVGGVRLKFTDNSGYIKVEIDEERWTVDYNNSDSYNLFVNEGQPYHESLDGVDICAIDQSGNKECVENVTIIDFDTTSFADVLAKGGKIVLPPDVTINLNGNVNIPGGTTIIGDASTKLIGSLTLTGNGITLQNVNVENTSGASITINNDVQNITIEGGVYTTTDDNLQGLGTIRGMGNNTVSISNATLRGGIHLFEYAGTNDDLTNNNITLDYHGDTSLSGIVVTTNEEEKFNARTIYIGNHFFIQNQPNSYYVLIQRPDWSKIQVVDINGNYIVSSGN